MLNSIAENIWHAQHVFKVHGVPISSRMTLVRLPSGVLWVHSPIPVSDQTRGEIDALGPVKFIIAPSKSHHLFAGHFAEKFPSATLYGAPGLAEKRPDLANMQPLRPEPGEWSPELEFHLFGGIPFANETVWFHAPSRTLILTDLCQWWQGELPWQASLLNSLAGVRQKFDVPRTVRAMLRDKGAAAASAKRIMEWPFQRIVMAHNTIIESDARAQLELAFRRFQ
ncbi:MAG: hypothetical protein A3E79_15690 [Burkholderiales bacterium RIFCSPHIGHO2_12_FULL_61_11]|nr:MAG: hypothetical protein A3E79_15690 [Burkholderiales bacterium RIFCSPHIGHO2_12_FULL_61_11]